MQVLSLVFASALVACDGAPGPDALMARAAKAMEQGDYKAAEIDIKAALRERPGDAAARIALAKTYLALNNPQVAIDELKRLADDPDSNQAALPVLIEAYSAVQDNRGITDLVGAGLPVGTELDAVTSSQVGLAYLGEGRAAQADNWLVRARDLDPDSPVVRTAWARYLWRTEPSPHQAVKLLEAIVSDTPEHAEAWFLKGRILLDMQQMSVASQDLSRALELAPREFLYNWTAALADIELKQLNSAARRIEVLESITTRHPGVNYLRGRLELSRGNYSAANSAFSDVLGQIPRHAPTLFYASLANSYLGNDETARQYMQTAAEEMPNVLQTRQEIARMLLQTGQVAEAEKLARELVEEDSMNPVSIGLLAAALGAQGQLADSEAAYQRMAELDPASAMAQEGLAQVALGEGDGPAAVAALERALEIDPNDTRALERLIVLKSLMGDSAQALELANAYAERYPGRANPQLAKARIHMQLRQEEEAATAFNRALELDPGNTTASGGLAAIAAGDGDLELARKYFRTALRSHPDHLPSSLNLFRIEQQLGNMQSAEQVLLAAQEQNPDSVEPPLLLASLQLTQGRVEEAVAGLRLLSAQHTADIRVLGLLARAELADANYNRAREATTRWVELAPGSIEPLHVLAKAEQAEGNYKAAVDALDRALTLSPSNTRLRKDLIDLHMRAGQYAAALAQAQQLPEEEQAAPANQLLMGRIAMGAGDLAAARGHFEQAFETAPANIPLVYVAQVRWLAGEREPVFALLDEWLEEYPQDIAIRNERASMYLDAGMTEEALTEYQWLLKRVPDNAAYLNNVAWILRDRDNAQALEYAARANEAAPNTPAFMDTYALILMDAGQADEAIRQIEAAAERAPASSEIQYHRALILQRAGRKDESAQVLAVLLAREGDFPERSAAQDLKRQIENGS